MNSTIKDCLALKKNVIQYSLFLLMIFSIPTSITAQYEYRVDTPDEVVTLNLVLPFNDVAQEIEAHVYDGIAYWDGDIVLGNIKDLRNNDRGVGITLTSYLWPNSTIPYTIGSGFSSDALTEIDDAINHVNSNTNLCLIPRTTEADYVQFTFQTSGCSATLGRVGGMQNINLSEACSFGNTVHEILHAAGIFHEQSRLDRDSYVTINSANIQTGYEGNFDQVSSTYAADYGTYDYGSIMHYGNTFFGCWDCGSGAECDPDYCSTNSCSGCTKLETITTIPAGIAIGQRTALSAGDINTLNTMYPTACSTGSGCPASEDVTQTLSGSELIEVSDFITASNTITSSADVEYSATNKITMFDGFISQSGSDFKAYILGCTPFAPDGGVNSYTNNSSNGQPNNNLQADENGFSSSSLYSYPNPFSSTTTIAFELNVPTKVNLVVYDLMGKRVAVLFENEWAAEGLNQVEFDASDLPKGSYIYTLQTETFNRTNKMTVIK